MDHGSGEFGDHEDHGMDHGRDHEHEDQDNGTTVQSDDPHDKDKQFCVDISEYLDLKWVLRDAEECHVSFNSQCEAKSENVCIDVTETKCEVVPYKECTMGLEAQEYEEKKLAPKLFVEKSCYQGKKTIPHKKMFPECKNVTKQNCVTLWETDENGEQVRLDLSATVVLMLLSDLGGDGPVRAGHLAGVQTRPEGRAVHRSLGELQ